MHGDGVMTWVSGDQDHCEQWVQGKMHGLVTKTKPDGSKLQAMFEHDEK